MIRLFVNDRYDIDWIASRLSMHMHDLHASSPGERAAVAAILRAPDGRHDAEVLFIRRAEHPHDPWSGHMAFPGGRRDPEDVSLYATAVRETLEEIGLDLSAHAEVLGRLPDVPAIARGKRLGLVIAPFVFAVRGPVPPLVHNHEVAEVVWAPLRKVLHEEAYEAFEYVHEGKRLELPCVRLGERVVWGLTLQMLRTLSLVLRADLMPEPPIG